MTTFSVSLRSGSSGNSTFIRTESAGIVIDCGMNGKQFALALASVNERPEAVDAILLTHEHSDHCSGLGVVMRRHRIPLYITEKTYRAAKSQLGRIDESLVHLIAPGQSFSVRDTVILPFSTPHDAIDPVGFRIASSYGDIGVATDLGHFAKPAREALTGCRIVYLEANFDPDMLETGSYPRFLKQRITSEYGHLSNDQAGQAASYLIRHGTEIFALSHLSQENNRPSLALRTVSGQLETDGAKIGRDYVITASSRFECSDPICCQTCLGGIDDSLSAEFVKSRQGERTGEQLSIMPSQAGISDGGGR